MNYTLGAVNVNSKQILRENPAMLYLFTPEVELMLETGDFELVPSRRWMSDAPAVSGRWNGCYITHG